MCEICDATNQLFFSEEYKDKVEDAFMEVIDTLQEVFEDRVSHRHKKDYYVFLMAVVCILSDSSALTESARSFVHKYTNKNSSIH